MDNFTLQDKLSKDEIESNLEDWYNAIEGSIKNQIPTINKIKETKPISSPLLRFRQHQYIHLQNQAKIIGWDINSYNYYRRLKTALEVESREIKNKNWEDTMIFTANKYKEPKFFLESN